MILMDFFTPKSKPKNAFLVGRTPATAPTIWYARSIYGVAIPDFSLQNQKMLKNIANIAQKSKMRGYFLKSCFKRFWMTDYPHYLMYYFLIHKTKERTNPLHLTTTHWQYASNLKYAGNFKGHVWIN